MRVCIAENLTQSQVHDYSLVLSAYNYPHLIQQAPAGWQIWVNEDVQLVCQYLIAQYNAENPPKSTPQRTPRPGWGADAHVVWICLLLSVGYILIDRSANTQALVRHYAADAQAIVLHGQIYRTVTALMLHSGYPHLIANLAGLAIFGAGVARVCGAGVGWLMILASGAIGNLINAFFFERGHVSIGASTAVFGALGVLAGHQFQLKWQDRGQRGKAWLPIAGALALLGFMGAGGVRTDILAHLFGLLGGVALGLVYTVTQRRPAGPSIQRYAAMAAIAMVSLAWAYPMFTSHPLSIYPKISASFIYQFALFDER